MPIPKIDDVSLHMLCKRIKPVFRFKLVKGKLKHTESATDALYYIKDVDPRHTAFAWDPKPTKKAKGLVRYKVIRMQHDNSYMGFFKPSLDEVMAQIPAGDLDKVVAFETYDPENNDVDVIINANGYHEVSTVLYTKKR